jgi:hypothetical protein
MCRTSSRRVRAAQVRLETYRPENFIPDYEGGATAPT